MTMPPMCNTSETALQRFITIKSGVFKLHFGELGDFSESDEYFQIQKYKSFSERLVVSLCNTDLSRKAM